MNRGVSIEDAWKEARPRIFKRANYGMWEANAQVFKIYFWDLGLGLRHANPPEEAAHLHAQTQVALCARCYNVCRSNGSRKVISACRLLMLSKARINLQMHMFFGSDCYFLLMINLNNLYSLIKFKYLI